jgi:hypothetical protein
MQNLQRARIQSGDSIRRPADNHPHLPATAYPILRSAGREKIRNVMEQNSFSRYQPTLAILMLLAADDDDI